MNTRTKHIVISLFVTFIICAGLISAELWKKSREVLMWNGFEYGYSNDELVRFWETELQPFFNKLEKSNLPYKEINDRYRELNEKIERVTHKKICVSPVYRYHIYGPLVLAAVGEDINNPSQKVIYLYVPALLDDSKNCDFKEDREAYEAHLITVFMHELEHACHNSDNERTQEEARAWAETCRHTLGPLVEVYGIGPRVHIERGLYQVWRACGRDEKSQLWNNEVARHYAPLNLVSK